MEDKLRLVELYVAKMQELCKEVNQEFPTPPDQRSRVEETLYKAFIEGLKILV